MNRATLALLAVVLTAAIVCGWLLVTTISLSLECGGKGGDTFWGPFLRHVCVAHDGGLIR